MSAEGKRSGWFWESKKFIVFGGAGLALIYFRDKLLPADFWQRRLLIEIDLGYTDILALAGIFAIAVAFVVAIAVRSLRKYKVYEGRENSMTANCRLIEVYSTNPSTMIRSTRVAHWRVAENSTARQNFRNLLTDRISKHFPVRRLWQIKDRNDFLQLQRYLAAYEQFDNYSLKAVVSKDVLMPEILSIGDRAASFSLPEPMAPRELGRTFHFFGKREISALTRYFDIMWDIAIPIKSAEKIHRENVTVVETLLTDEEQKLSRSKANG